MGVEDEVYVSDKIHGEYRRKASPKRVATVKGVRISYSPLGSNLLSGRGPKVYLGSPEFTQVHLSWGASGGMRLEKGVTALQLIFSSWDRAGGAGASPIQYPPICGALGHHTPTCRGKLTLDTCSRCGKIIVEHGEVAHR